MLINGFDNEKSKNKSVFNFYADRLDGIDADILNNNDDKTAHDVDIKDLIESELFGSRHKIIDEFDKIEEELKLLGRRISTISTYRRTIYEYVDFTGYKYIDQIDRYSILKYINRGEISINTKATRLKQFKPTLNRWYELGYIRTDLWKNIRIKQEITSLPVATENDIKKFISLVDLNKYHEFRDTVGILIMFYTGVRVLTLSKTTERMIDYDNLLIHFEADIMKNHQSLSLPIKPFLADMIRQLCIENKKIRQANDVDNNYLLITSKGNPFLKKSDVSTFSKRTNYYKKKYSIKTLNPHSLRRGFARKLLDSKVNIPTISKALNHSSLDTTTRYLRIDEKEMIDVLRDL